MYPILPPPPSHYLLFLPARLSGPYPCLPSKQPPACFIFRHRRSGLEQRLLWASSCHLLGITKSLHRSMPPHPFVAGLVCPCTNIFLLIPREIWNTKDSVVAQIGSGGSFHEFCTSVCLSLYEAQQQRPAPQSADPSDTIRCSVCHKPGEVSKRLLFCLSRIRRLSPADLGPAWDHGWAFAGFS